MVIVLFSTAISVFEEMCKITYSFKMFIFVFSKLILLNFYLFGSKCESHILFCLPLLEAIFFIVDVIFLFIFLHFVLFLTCYVL